MDDEAKQSVLDPGIVAELHGQLASVEEFGQRLQTAARATAAAGSPAALDNALPDARFVALYAVQALASAQDHLLAWRLIVRGLGIPIVSQNSLLRAALEGAVRSRWHVDRTVDASTRVGRGFAARLDDQRERAKFEASREHGERRLPVRGQTGAQRVGPFRPDRRRAIELVSGPSAPSTRPR